MKFLMSIVASNIDWTNIQIPEGRTQKACQHLLSNLKTKYLKGDTPTKTTNSKQSNDSDATPTGAGGTPKTNKRKAVDDIKNVTPSKAKKAKSAKKEKVDDDGDDKYPDDKYPAGAAVKIEGDEDAYGI